LKTVAWSILWSTVLTLFVVFVIQENNHCLLIVYGTSWMWTISISIWSWFVAFLSFDNLGRSILVVCSLLLFAFHGNVDRVPIAAAEAKAV